MNCLHIMNVNKVDLFHRTADFIPHVGERIRHKDHVYRVTSVLYSAFAGYDGFDLTHVEVTVEGVT